MQHIYTLACRYLRSQVSCTPARRSRKWYLQMLYVHPPYPSQSCLSRSRVRRRIEAYLQSPTTVWRNRRVGGEHNHESPISVHVTLGTPDLQQTVSVAVKASSNKLISAARYAAKASPVLRDVSDLIFLHAGPSVVPEPE